MIALLFNWKFWAAVLIAVALAASHWKVYKVGQNEVQAKWTAEKLDTAQQTLRLLESRDRTTTALQDNTDALRRTKNAQIARLDADLAAALAGLQDRPDRPGGANLPTDTGAGSASSGCTGKELFRDDGEFLTRLAGDADKLRINLKACYAQYEAARKSIGEH